jgi:hypothetical protein
VIVLVPRVLQDPQEQQVNKVRQGRKDLLERMGPTDLLDLRDLKVREDPLDLKDHKGWMV